VVFQRHDDAALFGFGNAFLNALEAPFKTVVLSATGQNRLAAARFHQIVEVLDGVPAAGVELASGSRFWASPETGRQSTFWTQSGRNLKDASPLRSRNGPCSQPIHPPSLPQEQHRKKGSQRKPRPNSDESLINSLSSPPPQSFSWIRFGRFMGALTMVFPTICIHIWPQSRFQEVR
jgi:hypothetical protein